MEGEGQEQEDLELQDCTGEEDDEAQLIEDYFSINTHEKTDD